MEKLNGENYRKKVSPLHKKLSTVPGYYRVIISVSNKVNNKLVGVHSLIMNKVRSHEKLKQRITRRN